MKTGLYTIAHSPSKQKTPELQHFQLSYRERLKTSNPAYGTYFQNNDLVP